MSFPPSAIARIHLGNYHSGLGHRLERGIRVGSECVDVLFPNPTRFRLRLRILVP